MKNYEIEVITPKGIFLKDRVNSISFDTPSGRIQILYGHITFLTPIIPSVLIIKKGDITDYVAIMEGALWFNKNKVLIMVDAAEFSKDIDIERAKRALDRAKERMGKKEEKTDIKRTQRSIKRAEVRIKLYELLNDPHL